MKTRCNFCVLFCVVYVQGIYTLNYQQQQSIIISNFVLYFMDFFSPSFPWSTRLSSPG